MTEKLLNEASGDICCTHWLCLWLMWAVVLLPLSLKSNWVELPAAWGRGRWQAPGPPRRWQEAAPEAAQEAGWGVRRSKAFKQKKKRRINSWLRGRALWPQVELRNLMWAREHSIPKRSHSHTFVSFHNAKFTKGDLPNKPEESHASYTQRKGPYTIEASIVSVYCEVPVTGSICRWRGSKLDCGTARLQRWVLWVLIAPPGLEVPTQSPYPSVQTCGMGCLEPPSKGVHYFNLL